MPKNNFSYKSILDNINKIKKQSSIHKQNNLNNSQYKRNNNYIYSNNNSNINNNSNSYKQLINLTNLEVKEKDINNFKEFKRIQDLNNKHLFQNGILNKNIESFLFPNNKTYNNILLKNKQNKHNNIDTNTEANKNNITSIVILKNKPLIVKSDPKRSSSCLNGYISKYIDVEDMKKIKTPSKRILVENEGKKTKNSYNTARTKNNIKNKVKFEPEENHFRAVFYEQEIKKYNMTVD